MIDGIRNWIDMARAFAGRRAGMSAALACAAAGILALGLPGEALAQEAEDAAQAGPTLDSGDTAWMLTSTALVLMMSIPGLALFYGGMVRKKNVLTILMQVFAIACVASVLWVVIGYSIAFGGPGAFIGGFSKLFLDGIGTDSLSGTIPETVFVVFQMTFAIITPALIVGAFADRMKFSAMLLFTALWVVIVYSPVAHWVWGEGGFIGGMGALDFAGGTVVHINSGVAGLMAAIIVGRRLGYGQENMAPHNLTLSVIGASLLWVGWFGFNAGSAVAADGAAGMAMLVTQLATAVAALTWMFAEWIQRGTASVLGIISGAIAGLVGITPASGFVGVLGAIVIGFAAGLICYWAATSLKRKLGYDDSLDVFGIHGIGGMVGAILTGVFAVEAIGGTPGMIEGNAGQILPQIYSVLITVAWTAVATSVLLFVVKAITGLRVTQEVERGSLDLELHGEQVQ